jgi:serine protease 16
MFAVEHRYYGCHNMSACPVTSFSSPDDLRFLSSAQALEDLAFFIGHATAAFNLSGSPWVAWGGRLRPCSSSVTGPRCNAMRVPSFMPVAVTQECSPVGCGSNFLISCMLPSPPAPPCASSSKCGSAPFYTPLALTKRAPYRHVLCRYNDAVAAAFAVEHEEVGGSPACESAIRQGHQTILELMSDAEGRQRLASLFGRSAQWYRAPELMSAHRQHRLQEREM